MPAVPQSMPVPPEANGYRITGPSREVYIQLDHSNPGDSVTEVQYPVEKE